MGELHELYARYRDRVAFFVVYIKEAHPEEGWVMTQNREAGIAVHDPASAAERAEVAQTCAIRLQINIPVLLDGPDNEVARQYGGFPDRLYLIGTDGRVVFQGAEGPFGFKPEQLAAAIERYLAPSSGLNGLPKPGPHPSAIRERGPRRGTYPRQLLGVDVPIPQVLTELARPTESCSRRGSHLARTYTNKYSCIMEGEQKPKLVVWVGSSQRDLKGFPKQVRRDIGKALYAAQRGETDPAAKPLKGFGGGRVMEIRDRHDTNAYRAVYTAQFGEVVYVLHAFQKKSKKGIATPKHEMDLIRRRLAEAERLYRERQR